MNQKQFSTTYKTMAILRIFITILFIGFLGRIVSSEEFDLHSYHSYDEIIEFLENKQKEFSSILKMETIAQSCEGRNIYLMKFSTNSTIKKPIILIDASTHAREWVTNAVALNLIDSLTRIPSMLEKLDWYIVPMVNPDGYEFSRTSGNRLWRKNRSPPFNSECFGVDLNRNYGYHWGESDTSSDQCLDTYGGLSPFSEPETVGIRDLMLNNTGRIKLYIALHSYGQYFLHPYGYTSKRLPNNVFNLKSLGQEMAAAVYKASCNIYEVISAGFWYEAAGGSDDYAYTMAKVPYVYTFELTKEYGFEYPENQLFKVFKESMAAFKVAARRISYRYFSPKKIII